MKLELYVIGHYSDTGRYYIGRLDRVTDYGTVSRILVRDDIRTKAEALALLKEYNRLGLRPVSELGKVA